MRMRTPRAGVIIATISQGAIALFSTLPWTECNTSELQGPACGKYADAIDEDHTLLGHCCFLMIDSRLATAESESGVRNRIHDGGSPTQRNYLSRPASHGRCLRNMKQRAHFGGSGPSITGSTLESRHPGSRETEMTSALTAEVGLFNMLHWLVNKAKENPKTVQGISGHSRIQTTLDMYAVGDFDEMISAQDKFIDAVGFEKETVR